MPSLSFASELYKAAKEGDLAKVIERVNAGDDVDYVYNPPANRFLETVGTSVLMQAVSRGDIEMVRFLIDRGADVNLPIVTSMGSYTALYDALYSENLSRQTRYLLVKMLMDAGAKYFEYWLGDIEHILTHGPEYEVALMQGVNALTDEVYPEIVTHNIGGFLVDLGVVYPQINDEYNAALQFQLQQELHLAQRTRSYTQAAGLFILTVVLKFSTGFNSF